MSNLNYAVKEAEEILSALGSATGNLEIALETETQTRQTMRTLKELYESAEAEVTSLALVDGRIDGKNAEVRKAQLDALLVYERSSGTLAALWRSRNEAIDAYDNAKMSLDQCSARYSATKHAADLKAQILRAMSA